MQHEVLLALVGHTGGVIVGGESPDVPYRVSSTLSDAVAQGAHFSVPTSSWTAYFLL